MEDRNRKRWKFRTSCDQAAVEMLGVTAINAEIEDELFGQCNLTTELVGSLSCDSVSFPSIEIEDCTGDRIQIVMGKQGIRACGNQEKVSRHCLGERSWTQARRHATLLKG